jgi:hypothetical protein
MSDLKIKKEGKDRALLQSTLLLGSIKTPKGKACHSSGQAEGEQNNLRSFQWLVLQGMGHQS